MTSIIKHHQSALALLAATLEQNAVYVAAFGYPSGKLCPHCGKEVFANLATLEQLALASPGSNLAHDYCHEISTLRGALFESEKQRPVELHITELPKPKVVEPAADEGEGGTDAGS